MTKYELIHIQPWNGKEVVIKRNLTEKQAIEYFNGIDNTYYREQEEVEESCKYCGTRKMKGFLCMECGRI